MATERIQIVVSSKGTVTVKREIEEIGNAGAKSTNGVTMLKGALSGITFSGVDNIISKLHAVSPAASTASASVGNLGASLGSLGASSDTAAKETVSSFGFIEKAIARLEAGAGRVKAALANGLSSLQSWRGAAAAAGASAQQSGFNVANLAAQFNDVGVMAAAGQAPLMTALQQGTQISQAFGQMGAAGAVKMLASALGSVLSPISLIVIATVALVAALIQWVNWSNVLVVVLTSISNAINFMIANLNYVGPLAIVVGVAMLTAFGPALLSAIVSVTMAVGVGLFNAFAAVFALIVANPVTATILAVGAAIVFVVNKTVGWQVAIENIIWAYGKVLEVLGRIAQWFTGNDFLTAKGIQIQINAKQAAADLIASGKEMATGWLEALDNGANKLKDGILEGSDDGAMKFKEAIAGGAQDAAPVLANAVPKGAQTAAPTISDAVVSGAQKAAPVIYSTIESAFATIGSYLDLERIIHARERAELAKTAAEIRNLNAQTLKYLAEAKQTGKSGSTLGFREGGQFMVGGTGAGTDRTPVAFNANRGERVTVETRKQQRANDNAHNSNAPANVNVPVTTVNVLDPAMIPSAMQSAAGSRALVNIISANRDEIIAALGVV